MSGPALTPGDMFSEKREARGMRKYARLLLALVLAAALTGCGGGNGPAKVVREFSEAVKKMDYAAMNACLAEEMDLDQEEELEEEADSLMTYLKEKAAGITYEIGETKTEEDTASVTVSYTYTDASEAMGEVMKEYVSQALVLAFSGGSEEEMGQIMEDLIEEKIAGAEIGQTTKEVTFQCEKTEDGWKISEMPEEIYDVVSCGILGPIMEMEEALEP